MFRPFSSLPKYLHSAGPFYIASLSAHRLRITQEYVDSLGLLHSPLNLYIVSIWNMLTPTTTSAHFMPLAFPHFSTAEAIVFTSADAGFSHCSLLQVK